MMIHHISVLMQTMPEMDFFLESTQQSPFENTYVYIRIYNINTVYRPEPLG